MGRVVGLAPAELGAHDGPGKLAGGPDTDPAVEHFDERPPHLVAGQGVNERIHGGVEHGQRQEPLGLVEYGARADLTGHVEQQQDEERRPARYETAEHDDDGLQKRHGLLRALVAAAAVGHLAEDQLAAPRAHQGVDAGVQDDDGHEDDAEHGGAEEDVGLVVERQHRGAVVHALDAVPTYDGKAAQDGGDEPHGADEHEHAARFAIIVKLHLEHGQVSLDSDGQETEHRSGQSHKHASFSEEPLGGGEFIRVGSRQQDVRRVNHSG